MREAMIGKEDSVKLYGIWFERSGWWTEKGHRIFATPHLREAWAQLQTLIIREVRRRPGANEENPPGVEWHDVPRVAEINDNGLPELVIIRGHDG
jgi:hypothetical protein